MGDAIAGRHVDETLTQTLLARRGAVRGRGSRIPAREKEVGVAGAPVIKVRRQEMAESEARETT